MRFGSVCSGIEAASVAWHPLGWRAAWLAEIEPFPSAVLAHHYPSVPNLGDMTALARRVLAGEIEAPDVLVGGTPCQAYSVAGMRAGLDDERGQLTLRFMELADAIDFVRQRDGKPPVVIVWENVPGVLSDKTNAFGCFLAGLAGEDVELQPAGKKWTNAGCVYGPQRAVAWRTLDAQYFGLAQRRIAFDCKASGQNGFGVGEIASTLRSMGHSTSHQNAGGHAAVQLGMAVRRLTPRECERLQGFPDDYTLIPSKTARALEAGMLQYLRLFRPDLTEDEARRLAADGPRYKALGNSMPVPAMEWIGRRLDARIKEAA